MVSPVVNACQLAIHSNLSSDISTNFRPFSIIDGLAQLYKRQYFLADCEIVTKLIPKLYLPATAIIFRMGWLIIYENDYEIEISCLCGLIQNNDTNGYRGWKFFVMKLAFACFIYFLLFSLYSWYKQYLVSWVPNVQRKN